MYINLHILNPNRNFQETLVSLSNFGTFRVFSMPARAESQPQNGILAFHSLNVQYNLSNLT
jgi:hypothetical protein